MTSTDLVARLRERFAPATRDLCVEAADRIEELEANLEAHSVLLQDKQRRIEELENVLRTACQADGACFSRYGACVCRDTIAAQSPSEQHQTPASVWADWAAKLER